MGSSREPQSWQVTAINRSRHGHTKPSKQQTSFLNFLKISPKQLELTKEETAEPAIQ